jgi:hypothetical protein
MSNRVFIGQLGQSRRPRLVRSVGLLLLGAGLFLQIDASVLPEAAGQQTDSVLIIALHPTVTTRERVIRLGAVADLTGGSSSLRRKIAELDLAEVAAGNSPLTIGSEQVSFRLQIAGVEPRAFRIEGRQVVATPAAQDVTEEGLFAAAAQQVRGRLPKFADNVSIVLAQPVSVPELKIAPRDRIRLVGELAPASNPLGLTRVPVAVIHNGERAATVPVILNISYVQRASAAEVDAEADNPILVKSHDMVRLVAKIGAIRVIALGEALQEGRRGEVIRVRNADSGNMVAGRIADAAVVEVEY